jgi:hypothetical protein
MTPAQLARADQILAVLREADTPIVFGELYRRLGKPAKNGWSVQDTTRVVVAMHNADLIEAVGHRSVFLAHYRLPADR